MQLVFKGHWLSEFILAIIMKIDTVHVRRDVLWNFLRGTNSYEYTKHFLIKVLPDVLKNDIICAYNFYAAII